MSYRQGCWVVAPEKSLDKLLTDGRFQVVQTWEKAAQNHG